MAASGRLQQEGRRITLDLYGPVREGYEECFQALLEQAGEAVTHHGYVDHGEMLRSYPNYDVLVLPTTYPGEGYPGVIIEALANGLPVIATRWRAIPEIVKDGENGLLCEPKDIDSLADCLTRIAVDGDLYARLAENTCEFSQRFSPDEVLARLCRLYGLGETE
jgi:glycosyltransferase involved in cell wall biosynthesis